MGNWKMRLAVLFACVFAAALVVGCSGQPAASSSSSAAEEQTPEQLIAELTTATDMSAVKSATLDMEGEAKIDAAQMLNAAVDSLGEQVAQEASGSAASADAVANGEAASAEAASTDASAEAASGEAASSDASSEAASEEAEVMTLPIDMTAKLDTSGDVLKMYMKMNAMGQGMEFYVNGDQAALVMGDEVVGGTLEEMGVGKYSSAESIMKSQAADFSAYADAVKSIEKTAEGDATVYTVVIDTAKLNVESDSSDYASIMKSAGLDEMTLVYRIDANGNLASSEMSMAGTGMEINVKGTYSDINSTTVPDMPKVTTTFEEFQKQMGELGDMVDSAADAADAADSGSAASAEQEKAA